MEFDNYNLLVENPLKWNNLHAQISSIPESRPFFNPRGKIIQKIKDEAVQGLLQGTVVTDHTPDGMEYYRENIIDDEGADSGVKGSLEIYTRGIHLEWLSYDLRKFGKHALRLYPSGLLTESGSIREWTIGRVEALYVHSSIKRYRSAGDILYEGKILIEHF
jgi:hypothetical protein